MFDCYTAEMQENKYLFDSTKGILRIIDIMQK